MDEAGLAALVGIGEQLFTFKLCTIAVHFLWFYDYFLTFGDEVKYAWRGRKSWAFALFIANRYNPLIQIIWSSVTSYGNTNSICQDTQWIGIFHSTLSTVLAQIAVALRVYAVTQRNKWIGVALSSLILAQLIVGIYMTVSVAVLPALQLPDINLDPFKFCTIAPKKLQELLFLNVGIAFEVFVFSALFVEAKKQRHGRHLGVPSLLDAILRDATQYFILLVLSNVTTDVFIIFAPAAISVIPGLVGTMLVPLMASRLMLSLRKAAAEPARLCAVSSMADPGFSVMSRTVRFSHKVPGEVPGTPVSASFFDEDVELQYVTQTTPKDSYGFQVDTPPASRSPSDDSLVT